MFDAKSILEGLVRGAAPGAQSQGGALGDILGNILQGGQDGGQSGQGMARNAAPQQGGGGLGDILGELGRQFGGASQQGGGAGQSSGGGLGDILGQIQRQLGPGATAGQPGQSGGGGLGDILGQIKDQLGRAGGAVTGGQGGQGGGIADVLGQILGQATQGVREGAARVGQATGAGDALGRATGVQSTDELLEKLKGLVAQNPVVAGGLGGLVLGTRTGRSVATSAAKIGALALIGGLAYKAFQNYQAGKPLITGAVAPELAPQGSGFEPAAVTNDAAIHYIQAMVAAAAADGRIDNAEQAKIMGSMKQAGLDSEAEQFLAEELNAPKSVEDLAASVSSPEEAIQLYTAARLAVEPDSVGERVFLGNLASALGIDDKLAAHIDAATRSAAA